MIPYSISKHILTIGVDYHDPKGGMAQVLYSYAHNVLNPFRFVRTTFIGNKVGKLFCLLWAIISFSEKCWFGGIKIVHIHSASYVSFWRKRIFIFLAKLYGKKVVFHVHGGKFKDFTAGNRQAVLQSLQKTDVVIALSDYWEEFFEKELNCPCVEVVPNIVPHPRLTAQDSAGFVEALFLGAINDNKGIFDLVNVIAEHQDTLRSRFCLHIGGIGETKRLKSLIAQHGIDDMVKYEGWIGEEQKAKLLSQADFFILPSYVEALPISILEAMSYRLPILSTPIGGIPEIVTNEKNGLLVEAGNKDSLFVSLQRMVNDAEMRSSMGKISYERVQPHFPENVCATLERIYTSLLQ